jgi:23S rRNA (guanosine2251-2'-O)-methyltransferase
LTDVRNFGAIARSALCFNIDAILIPNKNSVTVTADAIKTSAGALSQLPICRIDNPIEQLEYFIDCGFQIVGATEKSNQSYREIDWTLPSILVLGSEGRGISYNVIEKLTHKVTIPMDKTAFDSLNVSVSAGIILSEIFVQNSK